MTPMLMVMRVGDGALIYLNREQIISLQPFDANSVRITMSNNMTVDVVQPLEKLLEEIDAYSRV